MRENVDETRVKGYGEDDEERKKRRREESFRCLQAACNRISMEGAISTAFSFSFDGKRKAQQFSQRNWITFFSKGAARSEAARSLHVPDSADGVFTNPFGIH